MSEPTTTLPAVTLYDPWACLCSAGVKDLETRRGAVLSGFRGPLVIHRAKKRGDWDYLPAMGWPEPPRPPWLQDATDEQLDREIAGCAIGVVLVERTWRFRGILDQPLAGLRERARYHDLAGRYLSELSRASWLTEAFPARGNQGRWQITLPTRLLPGWALDWKE